MLIESDTAAALDGTPYAPISKEWIQNLNSFITSCQSAPYASCLALTDPIDSRQPDPGLRSNNLRSWFPSAIRLECHC